MIFTVTIPPVYLATVASGILDVSILSFNQVDGVLTKYSCT